MKPGKLARGVFTGLVLTTFLSSAAYAAFNADVEQAYNTAVQAQDSLDGLDVTVAEQTASSQTGIASKKKVDLKVSGIKGDDLEADILVSADEGSSHSYYKDGCYYTETGDGEILKEEMDRETIWKKINSNIYLDMTSNYLTMLYADTPDADGNVVYYFGANEESLGDYKAKLLDEFSDSNGAAIDSLQGTMTVDKDGHVTDRTIQMQYSIERDNSEESFFKKADADFHQTGNVDVNLPDLSDTEEADPEQPAVTLTPASGTLYATTDINVRAAGSLDAAVIGGLTRGSAMTQTGYTSDGWIEIMYDGSTGYVWGEYTSKVQPVTTSAMSGTMFATTQANVRESYSTDSKVLGVLDYGSSIQVTGSTDNGWIRVSYQGGTGYVSANLLSWDDPNYVKNKTVYGTVLTSSYSYLQIEADNGSVLDFNTGYASLDVQDYLADGDYVMVTYSGSGSPYTASSIVDFTSHGGGSSVQTYTVGGTVDFCSGNTLYHVGSDGVYRSFSLNNAAIDTGGQALTEGLYVEVTWTSGNYSDTRNLNATYISAW